jgi:hypothetical protein
MGWFHHVGAGEAPEVFQFWSSSRHGQFSILGMELSSYWVADFGSEVCG